MVIHTSALYTHSVIFGEKKRNTPQFQSCSKCFTADLLFLVPGNGTTPLSPGLMSDACQTSAGASSTWLLSTGVERQPELSFVSASTFLLFVVAVASPPFVWVPSLSFPIPPLRCSPCASPLFTPLLLSLRSLCLPSCPLCDTTAWRMLLVLLTKSVFFT